MTKEGVDPLRNRVDKVLDEVAAMETHLTNTARIKAARNWVDTMSEEVDSPRWKGNPPARYVRLLEDAKEDLATLESEARSSFAAFKERYVATLKMQYEAVSTGDDGLKLPPSRYRDESGKPASESLGTAAKPQADVAEAPRRRVHFSFAETREAPPAEGPLWDVVRRKDTLSLDEVEATLSQIEMEGERPALRDPLSRRLTKKLSGDLETIRRTNRQDEGVRALEIPSSFT